MSGPPTRRTAAQTRIDPQQAEQAATVGKALGDPTRLTIAVALRDGGELCVCDLSWVVQRAENLVSHHVRVLRTAGVVRSRRDGKMAMYSLTDVGAALLGVLLSDGVPA